MKTPKTMQRTASEADDYLRRARAAEHAAEMAGTAEAKQFYLETAKQWYEIADRTEETAGKILGPL
jgi:hypothetical protein